MTTKTVATHPAVATLERMARRGTLEVEHVLALAKKPAPLIADELDALCAREDGRIQVAAADAASYRSRRGPKSCPRIVATGIGHSASWPPIARAPDSSRR